MDYDYLASFCSQMAMIFRSGTSAAAGFLLLAEQEKDPGHRALLTSLYENVEQGMPVHRAMRETGVFSSYILNMAELGEYTGKLDDVFSTLSDYCRRQSRTARAIREAFTYPLLLLVTMLAVFLVLITKVLPIFKGVLAQFGVSPTPVTAALLSFGEALSGSWPYILAGALLLAALAGLAAVIPAWRKGISGFMGRIFLHTDAGKKTLSARFSAALSMLMSTGINMDASLELLENSFVGSAGGGRISQYRGLVRDGGGLAEAAAETELLEPVYSKILAVGVKSGAADTAMAEIAARCEEDMYASIDKLTGKIEPAVVVLMSAMVGAVMLSVLIPLLDILSALG